MSKFLADYATAFKQMIEAMVFFITDCAPEKYYPFFFVGNVVCFFGLFTELFSARTIDFLIFIFGVPLIWLAEHYVRKDNYQPFLSLIVGALVFVLAMLTVAIIEIAHASQLIAWGFDMPVHLFDMLIVLVWALCMDLLLITKPSFIKSSKPVKKFYLSKN